MDKSPGKTNNAVQNGQVNQETHRHWCIWMIQIQQHKLTTLLQCAHIRRRTRSWRWESTPMCFTQTCRMLNLFTQRWSLVKRATHTNSSKLVRITCIWTSLFRRSSVSLEKHSSNHYHVITIFLDHLKSFSYTPKISPIAQEIEFIFKSYVLCTQCRQLAPRINLQPKPSCHSGFAWSKSSSSFGQGPPSHNLGSWLVEPSCKKLWLPCTLIECSHTYISCIISQKNN